jgi:hypothetical protein
MSVKASPKLLTACGFVAPRAKQKGRLKICSKSVVFDPQDIQ